ncbi:MAG: flagellar biosynthetic protein FliO [Spirochaetota bacterium]|nr:flagellar biosynthetic protein FliO [Spirochaetota bacterium]
MKSVCCWLLIFISFQMVCPVLSYAQNDASADISSYEKEKISGIRDAYNQNANDNNSKRTFSPGVGRVSFSYFRLFFSLLLICAMIYLIYFFLKKKTNSLANKNAEETSVLLSLPLGMGKNVQVVYIAGKFLIIGVTNDSINYLSEVTDEKEIENLKRLMQEKKIKAGESFANVFQEILKISNVRNDKQKDFDYEESSVDFLQKQTMRINTLNEKKEVLSDKENIESDIKTDN